MFLLAATKLVVLTFAMVGWWWDAKIDEASNRDVVSIAKSLGYTATVENSRDPVVKIEGARITFWTYLEDCRMKSGDFLEQCSKIKFQTCWNLDDYGFSSRNVRNVHVFANDFNRAKSPARRFDTAYAFVVPEQRQGCISSVFFLNDGVSSQYIGANMRSFVRSAEEFRTFAKNWR